MMGKKNTRKEVAPKQKYEVLGDQWLTSTLQQHHKQPAKRRQGISFGFSNTPESNTY